MSEKGLRGGGKVGGRRKSERAAEDYPVVDGTHLLISLHRVYEYHCPRFLSLL